LPVYSQKKEKTLESHRRKSLYNHYLKQQHEGMQLNSSPSPLPPLANDWIEHVEQHRNHPASLMDGPSNVCNLFVRSFTMRFKTLLVALLAFATMVGTGVAQTGSITGQIFDPAGAVIPNAKITATSASTGFTRTVTSTSAGIYNFGALPPSVYSLSATATGFQEQIKKDVTLSVAATLPVNFTLSISGATAVVDVRDASSASVETDSFQLSTVIDSKQINDLPLILRDPYQLVLLSPGVVSATNNDGGVSVNGQRDRNNNFTLDGADNNDTSVPGGLGGVSSANPDSAQEFRVITNNFDAEFGRNTGAIIDVITRGGTNSFHGDAYEFGRYNALGARDFFNTKENGKQDPYVRNDFGASVGGPLWKDRTFFFLNGEVQRFRTTRTESTVTPTAAFKAGRFTYIDPTDGSQTPVDLTNPAGNPNNLSGLAQVRPLQRSLRPHPSVRRTTAMASAPHTSLRLPTPSTPTPSPAASIKS
jgi:hypothetical protein